MDLVASGRGEATPLLAGPTAKSRGDHHPATMHLLAIVCYLFLAIAVTHPLLLSASDHIANKPAGDQLWQVSILEHQYHYLFSDPGRMFASNFYFGSGNALFASDLLIGFQPLFAPLRLVSGNPIAAFNMTWILAFFLNALAMYFAVVDITRNRSAGLLAGTIYAFAPIALNFTSAHFQLAGSWWIPITLYASARFAKSGSWVHLALAIVAIWLQLITAAYLAIVAGTVFVAFGVVPGYLRMVAGRQWIAMAKATLAAILTGALFAPIVLGFGQIADDWNARRHISEVQTFSAEITDYASPSSRLRWYESLRNRFPAPTSERRVFPGFVPVAVAAAGGILALLIPTARRRWRTTALAAAAVAALGVLLSLGTHWKWNGAVTDIELPYLFLFENMPGFQSIRAVARFGLMFNFGVAILAALAVGIAARRFPKNALPSLLGLALTGAVVLEALPNPINVAPVVENSDLERLLRSAQDAPVLFVPVSGSEEIQRIWITTKVGAGPLVNGYSGYVWPQYWYFRDRTVNVPRQDFERLARSLRAYGIGYVVLDQAPLSDIEIQNWRGFARASLVENVTSSGTWQLLELREESDEARSGWNDLDYRLLVDSAPPASGITTTISFANRNPAPWIPNLGSHYRRASVNWFDEAGREVMNFETLLLPPPFLSPDGSHSASLRLLTPPADGDYRLRIDVDGFPLVSQKIRIGLPVERRFDGSGRGLRARLELVSKSRYEGMPSDTFALHVNALNLGPVIWSGDATVRLGWKWFRKLPNDRLEEMLEFEGRLPLLGHESGEIHPGNGYAFRGRISAPDLPGEYVVRISMLSELVAWFENPPIEIDVVLER